MNPAPREPVFRCLRYARQSVWVVLLIGTQALGQTPPGGPFSIPRERADLALIEFAHQAHLVVLFPYEEVSRVSTNAVDGTHTVQDALNILLRNTGLTGTIKPDGQLLVRVNTDPANAQDALASAAKPEPMPEVTITGSHVRDTGMNTPTPVTVVTSEQLEHAAPGNMIDAFRQLPQFLGGSSPGTTVYIGTDAGQSILNMRGLGENRTLVLLDGARIVPSNASGTVDINVLPQSLIKRVDVVTGGASAAYGSDAVAGVTNFILDTNYTGLRGRAQGGVTSRGDDGNKEAELTFGTAIGDSAHFIASADYYDSNAVETYSGRSWFQSWGTVTSPQYTATGQGPQLLVLPHVSSTDYTAGGLILQPGSALDRLMFLPNGTAVPFQPGPIAALGGTQSQSGGTGYDYEADHGGDGGLVPNVARYNAFMHLAVDLTGSVQAYGQALLGHNEVDGRGFGAVMFGPFQATIYQDNAYLPANVRQIMEQEDLPSFGLSRMSSSADLGIDRLVQTNSTVAVTTGIKATLTGDWHLNSYLEYGRNDDDLAAVNFPRTDRLYLAMDAVVDPTTGNIVCRSSLYNPGNGCVPIDLLGAGRASPQAIAYVTEGTKTDFQANTQEAFEATVDGAMFGGRAAGSVQLAFGVDYRRNRLVQTVSDPTNPTNDPDYRAVPLNDPTLGIQGIPAAIAGNNSGVQFSVEANFAGTVNVEEAFSEVLVPLLKDQPFAKQLNLSLAGRLADYTGSGTIWSYKGGLDWQTVDWLRFRGTLSRDVRAADMSERFNAAGAGTSVMDPQFNNQTVILAEIVGGNPKVRPEKADTYTAGVVLQPTWMQGLSVSVDWYSINIKDAIGLLGAQTIVTDCYLGDTQLCAQIRRDPVTQQIVGLSNTYLNINAAKVVGTDLEADYGTSLGGNRTLTFRLLGGYLGEESVSNVGTPVMQEAGTVGNMDLPRVQLNAAVTYTQGPYSAYLSERFISAGKRQYNDDEPLLDGATISTDHVASVYYTDLNLAYTFGLPDSGQMQLFLNITNLLDRPPPNAPNFAAFDGTTPTNESLYDILGRRFVVGFKFNFL